MQIAASPSDRALRRGGAGRRRTTGGRAPRRGRSGRPSDGKLERQGMDREQRAAHGLAWYATYVEALQADGALGPRAGRREEIRRAGAAHPSGGLRRISGPVRRRHRHEPERDRPALQSGPDQCRHRRVLDRGGGRTGPGRNAARSARGHRRPSGQASRRDGLWRSGPRRHDGHGARAVLPLCRRPRSRRSRINGT